jgi:hypothetical protein
MVGSVLRFVRLPLLLVLIWVIARFCMGLSGVPYAPRGNAIFSVLNMTWISCFYFGALSGRVGGLNWKGTLLVGIALGVFAEALIFLATWISYVGNFSTYFVHWDALNVPEGSSLIPMSDALTKRAGGIVFGGIFPAIIALLGRGAGKLIPVSGSGK